MYPPISKLLKICFGKRFCCMNEIPLLYCSDWPNPRSVPCKNTFEYVLLKSKNATQAPTAHVVIVKNTDDTGKNLRIFFTTPYTNCGIKKIALNAKKGA